VSYAVGHRTHFSRSNIDPDLLADRIDLIHLILSIMFIRFE